MAEPVKPPKKTYKQQADRYLKQLPRKERNYQERMRAQIVNQTLDYLYATTTLK